MSSSCGFNSLGMSVVELIDIKHNEGYLLLYLDSVALRGGTPVLDIKALHAICEPPSPSAIRLRRCGTREGADSGIPNEAEAACNAYHDHLPRLRSFIEQMQ